MILTLHRACLIDTHQRLCALISLFENCNHCWQQSSKSSECNPCYLNFMLRFNSKNEERLGEDVTVKFSKKKLFEIRKRRRILLPHYRIEYCKVYQRTDKVTKSRNISIWCRFVKNQFQKVEQPITPWHIKILTFWQFFEFCAIFTTQIEIFRRTRILSDFMWFNMKTSYFKIELLLSGWLLLVSKFGFCVVW